MYLVSCGRTILYLSILLLLLIDARERKQHRCLVDVALAKLLPYPWGMLGR